MIEVQKLWKSVEVIISLWLSLIFQRSFNNLLSFSYKSQSGTLVERSKYSSHNLKQIQVPANVLLSKIQQVYDTFVDI